MRVMQGVSSFPPETGKSQTLSQMPTASSNASSPSPPSPSYQHHITILKHHRHHHIINCIDIIFVTMTLRDPFSVFIVYCTVFTVHCAQCMYNIQCMLYTHKACNACKMRNEKIGKVLESVHSKDNAFIETYKKLKVNIWIIMFSLKTKFSFACYLNPIKKLILKQINVFHPVPGHV